MGMTLLPLVFTLVFLDNILSEEHESCKTPSGEDGECISIRKCPPLYELIKKRPISKVNNELLRKSFCGSSGNVPKMCCPRGSSENGDALADDVLTFPSNNMLPDPVDCGIDTGKKIVGGERTELDEFPWLAMIMYETPKRQIRFGCGGVIISKRYVLTAAHCVKGKSVPKDWKIVAVRLGEYNKDSDEDCFDNGFKKECLLTPPINVKVEQQIPHEKYHANDPNQKYDIALLRLNSDVNFTTDYIRPICLPLLEEERKKTYNGLKLTVAGWGLTEHGYSSSIKLKLQVPVRSSNACKSLYKYAEIELDETQICAGGIKDKNACKGDSGGPLMTVSIDQYGDASWYAAGVVSFGPDPCGSEGWPTVYTRVTKYVGWIMRHMRP